MKVKRPWVSRQMQEQWKSPRWRRKMRKVSQRNGRLSGAENGRKALERLRRDPKFMEKVKRGVRLASKKRWRDPGYKRKMLKVQKENGKKFMKKYWSNPKAVAKHKRRVRKQWEDPEFAKKVLSSHVKPSKPQISLFRKLCRHGVRGVRLEKKVGRFSLDIARFPIDVEVDGYPWHEKDHSKRDRSLNRLGWKVIRIKLRNNGVTDEDFKKVLRCLTRR